MTLAGRLLAAAALAGLSAAAHGAGPEQVEGLQPRAGEWLLEYFGTFGAGSSEGREHSGIAFYGVTDFLAVGGELQTRYRSGAGVDDGLRFDYDSVVALLRFSDPEVASVGTGLWLQAGLDSDGEVARLEARLIVQKETPALRARGNVMLRRDNQEDEEGALVAYSGTMQGRISERLALGVEGSGEAFRVAGFDRQPFEEGHWLGPAATIDFPLGGDAEFTVGLAYLRRLDPGELRDNARVQLLLRF
jgi:hypothetical protein